MEPKSPPILMDARALLRRLRSRAADVRVRALDHIGDQRTHYLRTAAVLEHVAEAVREAIEDDEQTRRQSDGEKAQEAQAN